jgi:predicted phosphodiesterase
MAHYLAVNIFRQMVTRARLLGIMVVCPRLLFLTTSFYAAPKEEEKGVTFAGAGDIASCESSGDEATAKLLDGIDPDAVFAAGDIAYESGTKEEFEKCYGPSWGRFKDRTYPAIGNHDYGEDGYEGMVDGKYDPSAYFDYFGSKAGERNKGWYSYDLGAWHVVLNSDCNDGVGCDPYSEQMKWLSEDLSNTDKGCILAYWHHPLYSSGYHRDDPKMRAAWNVLYGYGADVVINGHDHNYERFAPQDPYGNPDPYRGIREFVVGTGGKSLRATTAEKPNSEVLYNQSYGVLKLNLKDGGYDWEFVPVEGSFQDSGSASC